MSEAVDGRDDADVERPPWCAATINDARTVDFESVVDGHPHADCQSVSRAIDKALAGESHPLATAQGRIWIMLSAVLGMHFRPEAPNDPYGAMWIGADGRRSALLEDFSGAADVIAALARRSKHPVLRAHLSDVAWLLNKSQHDLATAAVDAYSELEAAVAARTLSYSWASEDHGPFDHGAYEFLLRALTLGQRIGKDKPNTVVVANRVRWLREAAARGGSANALRWFTELDLRFRISEPTDVAHDIENAIARLSSQGSLVHFELWRLAAQAYRLAKATEDAHRCQALAAECMVEQAPLSGSALSSTHWLSSAIAEMHGIPGKKDRRTELHHMLVDVQARIPDELSAFSAEFDPSASAAQVREVMAGKSLSQKLRIFATLSVPPSVDALRASAEKSASENPLLAFIGASHLDDQGKVIHRTPGGGGDGAFTQYIAQHEAVRRHIAVHGSIDVARRTILEEHYISDKIFIAILRHSPFVPDGQLVTYARGFTRYFQGDFVSGLYTLTPLLESSLRYVLRGHGHQVTKFDDASRTQEDMTISSLFDQMRPELNSVFGEDNAANIEHTFLKRPGPALRHAVAHGLGHDGTSHGPDAIYACWLIFQLCCIPILPSWERIAFDDARCG